MNLLRMMKQEVSQLGLTEKEQIKDYLYRRTGEIFLYDPLWKFGKVLDKIRISSKEIDIENVTDFYIVCFSWAPMFKKLLTAFDIEAEVKGNAGHEYVEVTIDGKKYKEDLTKEYEDIMRIKYGLDILKRYRYIDENTQEEITVKEPKQEPYLQQSNIEEILVEKKQKLIALKQQLKNEEYIYLVFKQIERLVNQPRAKVGYVCGTSYINLLLKLFIGKDYIPYNTQFFDNEKRIYMETYSIMLNGKPYYFVYRENEEGIYRLREATKEEIILYLKTYSTNNSSQNIVRALTR